MWIAEQTFNRWKKRYVGMGVAEVKKLKQLVAEWQSGQADAAGDAEK